jgi:hypothetical protein
MRHLDWGDCKHISIVEFGMVTSDLSLGIHSVVSREGESVADLSDVVDMGPAAGP